MALHKIKIIKSKTSSGNLEEVKEIYMDGVKLKGVQGINISASVNNKSVPLISVSIDMFAEVEIDQEKSE